MRNHLLHTRFAFCFLMLLAIFVSQDVQAQQDPAFVQYWRVEQQFNPASVGRTDQVAITGALQMHATGYDDAGASMFAGANTAFRVGKMRHGVGVAFLNDQIGIFSSKLVGLQYALRFKLFGGEFSVGLEGDILNQNIDGSKADLIDGSDPAFSSGKLTGSRFDASFGLYYQWKNLTAGIAMQHATAPTVKLGTSNEYSIKRLYNFTAGYNIKTRTPLLTIAPSAMFRTDLVDYRADVSCRFLIQREKQNFYVGAGYSPFHSVTLMVGGTLKGIELGYSYEANTEGLGIQAGNHEITLGYRLDLHLDKKGRNLHKSVRWL